MELNLDHILFSCSYQLQNIPVHTHSILKLVKLARFCPEWYPHKNWQ